MPEETGDWVGAVTDSLESLMVAWFRLGAEETERRVGSGSQFVEWAQGGILRPLESSQGQRAL